MRAFLLATRNTTRLWPVGVCQNFCKHHWGDYTSANDNPNGQTIPRGGRNDLTIGILTISRRYGGVNCTRASIW